MTKFCCVSHFRNHRSYRSVMVYLCKMMISLVGFFFFLHFFKLLIFQVVREMKGQIMIQNGKKYVSCTISREPFIIWFLFVVHKCKMMIIYRVFFNFFKILIFQVVSGVKGQKMAQKFCLLCSISQEAYIIWPWFLEHMCEVMTSSDAFFSFSKFDFSGC